MQSDFESRVTRGRWTALRSQHCAQQRVAACDADLLIQSKLDAFPFEMNLEWRFSKIRFQTLCVIQWLSRRWSLLVRCSLQYSFEFLILSVYIPVSNGIVFSLIYKSRTLRPLSHLQNATCYSLKREVRVIFISDWYLCLWQYQGPWRVGGRIVRDP